MANYLLDTNHAAALVTLSHPLRQRVLQRFAVIALRYDLVLLTSDKDFVPVPGLKQENWLVP